MVSYLGVDNIPILNFILILRKVSQPMDLHTLGGPSLSVIILGPISEVGIG